jgi:integrase
MLTADYGRSVIPHSINLNTSGLGPGSASTVCLCCEPRRKLYSEQLGHASTAFTLDTYAHVLPHKLEEAAARIEAIIFGEKA